MGVKVLSEEPGGGGKREQNKQKNEAKTEGTKMHAEIGRN